MSQPPTPQDTWVYEYFDTATNSTILYKSLSSGSNILSKFTYAVTDPTDRVTFPTQQKCWVSDSAWYFTICKLQVGEVKR